MKLFIIIQFLLYVSCLDAQSGKFTYIQLGDVGIEGLQNLVMQETAGIEYTILYYSADFCAPCKKIKKSLEEGEKDGYQGIRLIEINEKNFPNGSENPVWKKYNIRAVPILIHIDRNLNELNRNISRGWKKEHKVLNRFIQTLWPDKTEEELKEEKREQDQSRNRDQLFRKMATDTGLSSISRGYYQNRFIETIKEKYQSPKVEIASFNDFKSLTPTQIKSIKHLQLWWHTTLSESEQKIIQSSLSQFENLEFLEFFGDQFVPDEIYKLKKLKILFLNGGYDKVTLPEAFTELKELEILQLGYSSIHLPKNIHQMKNLKSILMPGEALNQPIELFDLPQLEHLSLKFTSEEKIKPIQKLRSLKFLETNIFVPEINDLTNLKVLNIYEDTIGNISHLIQLEVLSMYSPPGHTLDNSVASLASLKALFLLYPKDLIYFPQSMETIQLLDYVLIAYYDKWPYVDIPKPLKNAKCYVEYIGN